MRITWKQRIGSVFEKKYVYGLGYKSDIPAMEKAAGYLLGEHDFKSFCSNKRMKKEHGPPDGPDGIHTDGTVVFTYTGNVCITWCGSLRERRRAWENEGRRR